MHLRRGVLGWGVFLILAGAVPLGVRAGVLDADRVLDLWTLWPMLLIGLGIGLILGRSRFEFLGGLIVAATMGLIVGGLLSVGVSGISSGACGGPGGSSPFADRTGTFGGATATVAVDLDCGDLTIGTATGGDWRIAGSDDAGRGPRVDAGDASLDVDAPDDGPFGFIASRSSWQVTLPTDPTLDVDVDANAGAATLDLAGAAVGVLSLDLNAGSATVDLEATRAIRALEVDINAGSAGITLPTGSMTGDIEANAGAVRLCLPAGVGLRIRTEGGVAASYDFDGLVQDGDVWSTPDFDSAAAGIDLRIHGNAASFMLDPEDGCDG